MRYVFWSLLLAVIGLVAGYWFAPWFISPFFLDYDGTPLRICGLTYSNRLLKCAFVGAGVGVGLGLAVAYLMPITRIGHTPTPDPTNI